jgi:hypothetical protein
MKAYLLSFTRSTEMVHMFSFKKQHAERTISHLYEVMARRNVMTKETKNRRHTTDANLFEWMESITSNSTLNLQASVSKYNVCDEN